MVKLGSLVSGVVDRVTTHGVVVYVNSKGYSMGTISTEHLADHHGIEVYWKFFVTALFYFFGISRFGSLFMQGMLL